MTNQIQRIMKNIALNFAVVLMAAGTAIGAYHITMNNSEREIVVTEQSDNLPVHFTSLNQHESAPDFQIAAENAVDAVVHISNEFSVENNYYDPLRQLLYGDGHYSDTEQGLSSGSGVIISPDGFIITNNHVIEDANQLTVTLNDNRQYVAEVIGTDPATDLALVKVEANGLDHVELGNSDEVRVGQWVLAIGNPFNLTSTVTAGIVSAKARNINLLYDPSRNYVPLESFIQTDAAVNPGNSGGALISATGELIGINTAIASNTGSYSGYSFAVPVNIVKKVAFDLIEFGEVKRAFIGVTIQAMTQELANQLNIENLEGVFVAGLLSGGAAELAGIKEGDIITHVDNIRVTSVPQLQESIGVLRPGDEVEVMVNRNDKTLTYTMLLRDEYGNIDLNATSNKPNRRS